MKYLDGLNEAQKNAVLAKDGPVSVLAGAGAGKTRVLTTRIYHLMRCGVSPERILAVTFTNKAAREMRERVRHMLGGDVMKNEMPFIATFHGLGRELLERYGAAIGVPRHFSIYDRDDSQKVVAQALKSLDISAKELSPRAVLARISRAKGDGMSEREFREKNARTSFSNRTVAEVWRIYEQKLAEEKALDFDDLIVKTADLLDRNASIRTEAQSLWDYLHIDEYQDTNALQARLANVLAEKHKNVFVVGDIDQCIYTWRGATIENLLKFSEWYPHVRTIVLEQNYRSTKNLVAAANAIIEKNKNRKEKHSTTKNEEGEKIYLHCAANAEDEARWIAAQIREMMRAGEKPEDIAILFRTNFQSRALEEGLLRAGVPYKLLGTRFFGRKEVKDALAWMRLAMDPSREADKIRAAASPPRGLGRVTLAKLAAGRRDGLRVSELARVEEFERTIEMLANAAQTLIPSEFVKLVIEESGMRRVLLDEGSEEDRERFENIEELVSVAVRYDPPAGGPGKEGIALFLAESALASDQDEMDQGPKTGVILMTVHAAKGLEFNTVFVSGMEEGLFPHEDVGGERDRDEEEERRLFYVAITRAKKRLFLTFARIRKIYGSDRFSAPSSFLSDFDTSHLAYDEDADEKIVYV